LRYDRAMSDPRCCENRHLRIEGGAPAGERAGALAVEEPLEIRIHGRPVTVTMRTPGDDFDLAAGLLLTEGILRECRDIGTIRHCAEDEPNIVDVTPATGVSLDLSRLRRNLVGTSSCGLCGKVAIEQVRTIAPPLRSTLHVPIRTILRLPEAMRRAQATFEKTGGLHAAGLFAADGSLEVLREDVGRHNAVDKTIGAQVLSNRTPLEDRILMVSGRASFEILQKALMASIPVVCAVSAPSSLAVAFARESGMTLVGFLRGTDANIYAGEGRID